MTRTPGHAPSHLSVWDSIVRRLDAVGVRAIFGVPGGGGNLDLIEAAGRAGLPFVLTATETGGALAAVAQAEVTGRPGACLTTLGPGAASVANGIACAFLDRVPILVFTDSHPADLRGAFEHQHFDQQALLRPITRWSGQLSTHGADRVLDEAFDALIGLPPGPVHLDCAGEIPQADPREAAGGELAEPDAPRADDTGALAAAVGHARRPLLIIGLGARRTEDAAAIRAFIERRRLPAMVTYKAKGVVPDAHPGFAGVFTNAHIERATLSACDLIIGVGLDPVELLPRPWTFSQPVVQIGPWRMSLRHVPFAVQRITDVPTGLAELDALLPDALWDLAHIREHVIEQRQRIDLPGTGLTAQRVVRLAAERLAQAARVTVDAGAHMLPATMLWPVTAPNQMLISNGLSTMGFALPAAIGAALADRSRPVVALTGDGGLLMCVAELLTAVREKLRIIVIVFNDAALSLIEIKQQRRGLQPAGVALGSVTWTALAEGFGAVGYVATSEPELSAALDEATAAAGPVLIDARIDRTNYIRTLEIVRG